MRDGLRSAECAVLYAQVRKRHEALTQLEEHVVARLSGWLRARTHLPQGVRREIAEEAFLITIEREPPISPWPRAAGYMLVVAGHLVGRLARRLAREVSIEAARIEPIDPSSTDLADWLEFRDEVEHFARRLVNPEQRRVFEAIAEAVLSGRRLRLGELAAEVEMSLSTLYRLRLGMVGQS